MPSALTPLGKRTLAGFVSKYGAKQGPAKFRDALDKGLIDRGKMENVGLADDAETADDAAAAGEEADVPVARGQISQMNAPIVAPARSPTGPSVGRGAPGRFQKRPG
jgi:hypothetical protein